ncbi:MAG TPA: 4-hydroxy-tetrahydrodipicolinate reductase [Terriglobales bacterium]|nr:4-hydroxy-tetrahydrodipicolinate reductase [Terriglobales bacterium]
MNLLILGRGKTGSLVAEVAAERKHHVRVAGAKENPACAALTAEKLHDIDAIIDFSTPHVVLNHIEACVRAGRNMVVGTTGWYGPGKDNEIDRIRALVERNQTGFVFAGNFSIGVNLFYDVARAAAAALRHDYSGQIFERHHATKKDAPSGTAIALKNLIREACGEMPAGRTADLEITSFREGEVVGLHEVVFESPADRIYLCHDAKSRRGFAEGAVRAAEWLAGKKGFYNFKDVWREL